MYFSINFKFLLQFFFKLKLVSVIIPVFNSRDTLERAVSSVVYEPLVSEIFIVDDGSSDGSYSLAQKLAQKFPLVRVLHHPNKENKGGAASRNLGLSFATAEFVQFLDADDELISGKLKGQIEAVDSDVTFVVGNSIHVFPNGRRHLRNADNNVWKGLIRSNLGTTSSLLFNRGFLNEIGGWEETLGSSQEYDLMFRLLKKGAKVVFDSRHMTLIYQTKNSISNNPKSKDLRIQNWLALRERVRTYLIKTKNFDINNQYYWSGAVGIFCQETNIPIHPLTNPFLYSLYRIELKVRRLGYQIRSTIQKILPSKL